MFWECNWHWNWHTFALIKNCCWIFFGEKFMRFSRTHTHARAHIFIQFYRQKLQNPESRFISSVHCICLHFFLLLFVVNISLSTHSLESDWIESVFAIAAELFYVISACECRSNSIFIHSIFNSNFSCTREWMCVIHSLYIYWLYVIFFYILFGHCCSVFAYYFLLLLFLLIIFFCLYTYTYI